MRRREDQFLVFLYMGIAVCVLLLSGALILDVASPAAPAEYEYWEEDPFVSSAAAESQVCESAPPSSASLETAAVVSERPERAAESSASESMSTDAAESSSETAELSSAPEEGPSAPRETTSTAVSASGQPLRINLNTATVDELCLLDGIGPVLAQRIVDYRNEHGGFSAIEEVMAVKGIAEKRFAAIEDDITVE